MELLTAWTTTDDADVVLSAGGEGPDCVPEQILSLDVLAEVHVQGPEPAD